MYRTKKKKEKNMSHFDERSGVVYCRTPWGQWGQTMEEVTVEVQVPEGTKTRDLRCDIKPRSISIIVNKEDVVRVSLSLVTRPHEKLVDWEHFGFCPMPEPTIHQV